jgi:hypothetical protein
MEKIFLKADAHYANEEIPCLIWKSNVNYWVHKCQPLVPVLSQMNYFYSIPLYLLKMHFNITL